MSYTKICKNVNIKTAHLYVFSATFNPKVRQGWNVDSFDN